MVVVLPPLRLLDLLPLKIAVVRSPLAESALVLAVVAASVEHIASTEALNATVVTLVALAGFARIACLLIRSVHATFRVQQHVKAAW